MKNNQSLLSFIEYILNIAEDKDVPIYIDQQILRNEYDFNSFDDDEIFYSKILSHLLDKNDKKSIFKNIRSLPNFFLRNLIVFLEYLRTLINSHKYEKLYQDSTVKLDISIIIEYLTNKYEEKIVESIEFFPSCIKELEKKYDKNKIDSTFYDIELKKNANLKLKIFAKQKRENFNDLISCLQKYYNEPKHFSQKDIDKIDEIDLKSKKLSLKEIEDNYLNNDKFKEYIDLYLEKELLINGYDKKNYQKGTAEELYKQKKKQIKNNLFYSDILNINLNDIDNCVYLLYFESKIWKDKPFFYMDEEYNNLMSRKEINDFTDDLKRIIEDESFIKDLKEILNQNTVKNYFERVRRFSKEEEEDNYEVDFIEKEEEKKDEDDFLKDGFDRFMNFIYNDKNFFSKLFIFKYLPKNRRAFVDPNMRIVINPIYFELSGELDDKKKIEIFRAYLLIIILHEIAHLVKFMKEKSIPYNKIPQTPKKKEGGKMFINYLFKTPMIYSINYEQATIINKPENWNKTELLSELFKEQNEWYKKNIKDKNEDTTNPLPKGNDSISFYLSLVDEDNSEKNSENTIDVWYDID